MPKKDITCIDCGDKFVGHNRTKRCDPCAKEAKKLSRYKSKKKVRSLSGPITNATKKECQDCEGLFTGTEKNIRCEPCQEKFNKEASRASLKRARAIKRGEIKLPEGWKATDREITCLDCGTKFVAHYATKRCKPCGKKQDKIKSKEFTALEKSLHDERRSLDKANGIEITDRDITCPDCGVEFVAHYSTERCDECQEEEVRRRQNTPEYKAARKVYDKKYREENGEEINKKNMERYYENHEERKLEMREYYKGNKDDCNARNQKWAEENRPASKAIKDKWIKNNPEKHRAAMERGSAMRRARKLNAILPDTDSKKIGAIFAKKNEMNVATGIPHEVDHIIALVRGGAHHQGNLRVITESENRKKGQKYDPSLGGVWANNDLARETKKKLGIK